MHIYFSGIGGAGIGPLALITSQAGYMVSGSDKKESQYTKYLQKHGVSLHIGQTHEEITKIHDQNPIDWIVMSSAVPLENPNHPELIFASENAIRVSKRDELLNLILEEKKLQLIAVAGTHGKTTATAMLVWACQRLGIPASHSVGAKISFGDMGHFEPDSKYFLYECDEFDRNFLQFNPYLSIVTVVDWDHHDIFPTKDNYKAAFIQFITQSCYTIMNNRDAQYLDIKERDDISIINDSDNYLASLTLAGLHNRQNALVVAYGLQRITSHSLLEILSVLNDYPGSERRFEKLAPNIYTDYAHTPEEIIATMQLAKELNDKIVVVYEPLTNKRQHFTKELYQEIFEPAVKVYWTPSYLAREDPNQHVLTPSELIAGLSPGTNAEVANLDEQLLTAIKGHAANGELVLCMAGGGGGSFDEFLRAGLRVQ